MPENVDSKQEKVKINIISDILLHKSQETLAEETVNENPTEFIADFLNNVIEDAIEICEKNQLNKFTKEGKIRKRKIRDPIPLEERKKHKREETIAKHAIQETCKENCRKKCSKVIDTNRQNAIHCEFWTLNYEQQRQFIFSSVKKIDKKRTTDRNSRRSNTIVYTLKNDFGIDVNVCKKFYLAILGYPLHNDRIIRDILNKTDPTSLLVKPLQRGHPSEKKVGRQPIIDHINSFNPSISHYRREHAPNRKYLPSDINIKLMHSDYMKKFPGMNVSYELYRQQVAAMNISFAVLGHEECWQCETFDLHSKESKHDKKKIASDCEDCQKFNNHQKDTIAARNEYKMDASLIAGFESLCFSADLQKVSRLIVNFYISTKHIYFFIGYNATTLRDVQRNNFYSKDYLFQ